jgi:hypothetical protein
MAAQDRTVTCEDHGRQMDYDPVEERWSCPEPGCPAVLDLWRAELMPPGDTAVKAE